MTITKMLAAKLAECQPRTKCQPRTRSAMESNYEYFEAEASRQAALGRTTTPALIRALQRIAESTRTHRAYCEEHGADDCDVAVIDRILADLARELKGQNER